MMSSGASLQVVLGESHDCCKLTFRREGGNLSFTLGLTKSSKNSVDVKKDWVTRKLLMGLGIVCRV
jgi:hypothetical protein